jgi:hypothetical protein
MKCDESPYRLRAATPADEPFLTSMLELASNWRPLDPSRPPNPVDERYVARFGRPGDLGVVAEDPHGRPAGAAWCRLRTAADRGYGYVADDVPELTLAVSEEHRGHARRIYERAGFTRCGTSGGSWTMLIRLG